MKLEEVTPLMEAGTIVFFRGIKYYISACFTRYGGYGRKGWWYQLELHDLKANSVTIAAVEEVKILKSDENDENNGDMKNEKL